MSYRWGTGGPGSEAICKRALITPERKGLTSKLEFLPTGIFYFPAYLTMAAQIQKTKKLQLFKSMLSLINWDFQNVCGAEKKPK